LGDTRLEDASGHRGYAFGPFVVDPVKRTLWRDGRPVPITSKTFDVLVVLLEHRDHIVSKDDLLTRVWPNTAVNENNLARQISSLRRALGERPDLHDFVVTVPGHGYRFVAAVQDLQDVPPELHNAPSSAAGEREVPWHGGSAHRVGAEESRVGGEPPSEDSSPVKLGEADAGASNTRKAHWRVAGPLVAASCAVLAIVITGMLLRPADPSPPARRMLQRITYDEAALPRDAAWAPDGQWIVYASDRAGNSDLWKQRPGDPDPVRLTTSDAIESQPHWSPDGQSIVFRSERDGGGLYIIPATGGVERRISSFGYDPHWSPDGSRILFKQSGVLPDLPTIFVVDLDGQPPRPVRPDVLGEFSSVHVAWHPDARRVSIWGTRRHGEAAFVTVPLDGGDATAPRIPRRIEQHLAGVVAGQFVWAPSRRYIYFEGRTGETQNVWRIAVDPVSEDWIDAPERLTVGTAEETSVALSSDGTRLAFTTRSSTTRLWAFPFDPAKGRVTGQPEPITPGSLGEVDFDVRSDGSKVAYRAVRAGRNELWERTIGEGRERLLLASTEARLAKPFWSPDGARVAFLRCAVGENRATVAVLNADGTARVLASARRVEMQGSDWSKDGQAILGACRFSQSERYSTCLVPVSDPNNGREPAVRVIASDPKSNLFNQRFSPNQRWITFLAHDLMYASTSTVYVVPAAGGSWRAITDGAWFDDKPRWGPDGKIMYFVSNRTGVANVWARRFDDATGAPLGEPFPVTSFRSAQFQLTPRTVQMDIGITAAYLLLPMSESRSEIWMLDHVDR
jgi:Tol biopolymer transport system component/DNA-binding winged helix-turn-helix (wHTH) protein